LIAPQTRSAVTPSSPVVQPEKPLESGSSISRCVTGGDSRSRPTGRCSWGLFPVYFASCIRTPRALHRKQHQLHLDSLRSQRFARALVSGFWDQVRRPSFICQSTIRNRQSAIDNHPPNVSTNSNVSPSKRPWSLSLSCGMTSSAMNESVINGASIGLPRSSCTNRLSAV